jgi:mycofactocin precursor
MASTNVPTTRTDPGARSNAAEGGTHPGAVDSLVDEELLVEEISIDGMCGVY